MAIRHTSKVPFQRVQELPPRAQEQLSRNFDAVTAQLVPTGAAIPWFGQSSLAVPSDFLPCDGTVRKRAAFPSLFAVIGTSCNVGGEGSDEFRLPLANDSRFIRGASTAGTRGGTNSASMPSHDHGGATLADGAFNVGHDHNHDANNFNTGGVSANHTHAGTTNGHSHVNANGTVFMNCSATHGHAGGCGQASESPSYGGCTGFGCNITTNTVADNFNTAGISVDHVHNANHGHTGHSNHSVGTHTHLINAAGSGDNQPLFTDARYIIKT